ncbi:hypothetical protein D3C87_1709650 [compost metagenome]
MELAHLQALLEIGLAIGAAGRGLLEDLAEVAGLAALQVSAQGLDRHAAALGVRLEEASRGREAELVIVEGLGDRLRLFRRPRRQFSQHGDVVSAEAQKVPPLGQVLLGHAVAPTQTHNDALLQMSPYPRRVFSCLWPC